MSELKHISPLLDGFTLGSPIGEHHGVVCCPAIKENTNKKYIVKIISVPGSQSQFDALLLAGAYKDPGDAMEYFRENGEEILKEADILKTLSRIEGFLPYEGWQMEPIARRRLGYEVYLVGSYKRSLEKYMQKNAFTHLEAVNLGLDLCSALSVCRQSGYLYADLKPSNIYVSEKKEFRIGDLGFLNLDALRYASLPQRYHSSYTPPELLDPMAEINLTVDTYAVGMILYQIYNDGHLPFHGVAPLETLPRPCHADYEMAEIILKAIHPDPEQRWTDPKDLGKAIASYMQRNGINDIPITPFTPLAVEPEPIVETTPQGQTSEESDNHFAEVTEEIVTEEFESEIQESVSEVVQTLEQSTTDSAEDELVIDPTTDSEPADEPVVQEESSEEVIICQSDPDVQEIKDENTLADISEEVARIISKADDIIAYEIPEEVVFPLEEKSDPFDFVREDSEENDDIYPEEPLMADISEKAIPEKEKKTKHFEDPTRKKKFKKFLTRCFAFILLSAISIGSYWYYQNVYLQTVDSISISGTQTEISVLVDTSVDESMIAVHCIDPNGKRRTTSLQGGKATFSGLQPSTEYSIQLEMSGFHKLVGNASDVFTTGATTQILSFSAIAGSEDGAVMLEFTVDGEEPTFWNIRYGAEGEEEMLETITDHSAQITGLTIGKVYTFTLDGGKNFDLGGATSVQYLASKLVLAEDVTLTSSDGSDITVQWNTPGDVVVDNWNVRFYDGYGFEEEITVKENSVSFTGIDPASHYTVEITAAGMTEPSRINISVDPFHISDFKVDESTDTKMKLSWEYAENNPEGGWILNYTVDGSGNQAIACDKAVAEISPLIPGASYRFVLQSADDRSVINNTVVYHANEAEAFTEHKFNSDNVTFDLLKTPEDAKWHFDTISGTDFTKTFAVGDSASMVMHSNSAVYLPGNKTVGLFVFRDSYGNVLPEIIQEITFNWKDLWMAGNTQIAEMDLPALPAMPGSYAMEVYFNGCFVTKFDITITE